MRVFVTKANGSRQLFDKDKAIRTCLKMGASSQVANAVVEKVESRLYDGISTKVDSSHDYQVYAKIQT